jgi:hypothetical protein
MALIDWACSAYAVTQVKPDGTAELSTVLAAGPLSNNQRPSWQFRGFALVIVSNAKPTGRFLRFRHYLSKGWRVLPCGMEHGSA